MAADGLAHQRSQGHGEYKVPPGPRISFYKLVDSVLPTTKDTSGHEKDFFDGIDTSLPSLATLLGRDEKKAPWLGSELRKIAGHLGESAEALSGVVGELESLSDRLDHSALSPATIEEILDLLSAKKDEAETALNLALNITLDASVTPPQGPEAAAPPLKDALINVSPGQKFEIIGKLHNGSKHWLNVQGAELDPIMRWARRVHAEQTTLGPGEDYYANFFIQVPADASFTRPYWHRDDPETDSVNQIPDEMYQTLPFAPTAPQVTTNYDFEGRRRPHSPLPFSVNGYPVGEHLAERGAKIVS
jgi:hypothetical protein